MVGASFISFGQERTQRILELVNGTTVKGYVMEQGNGGYMLETDAGDIVFFSRSEVRAVKEIETSNNNPPVQVPSVNQSTQRITLSSLLELYSVREKLSLYKSARLAKKKKKSEAIEDELWEIESKVKKDESIPESVRDEFVDYIEDEEDNIEKEAKRKRK